MMSLMIPDLKMAMEVECKGLISMRAWIMMMKKVHR